MTAGTRVEEAELVKAIRFGVYLNMEPPGLADGGGWTVGRQESG